MSDSANSSSDPSVPHREHVFRESFLVHLLDPVTREAFEHIGDLLSQWAYEWKDRGWESGEEWSMSVQLRVVLADLRDVTEYLQDNIAQAVETGEAEDREEAAVSLAADRWVSQLRQVEESIERTIARLEKGPVQTTVRLTTTGEHVPTPEEVQAVLETGTNWARLAEALGVESVSLEVEGIDP